MTRPKQLKLDLLENGIDFVRAGIDTYFSSLLPEARAHKYGILHLISGLALLVKERLRREHPSLVFTRVEDCGRSDAHTVTFDQALDRLNRCAEISFEPRWKQALADARKQRNQIEHYEFTLDLNEAEAQISQLVEFTYVFMRDHLQKDLRQYVGTEAWHHIQELREIADDLEKARHQEWLSRAKAYFELTSAELARLVDEAPYHPKHNPQPQERYWCEQCGEGSAVVVEPDISVCTNPECGEVFEIPRCLRCEEYVPTGEPMCDYCSHMAEKD